jgi:hypothetical protein
MAMRRTVGIIALALPLGAFFVHPPGVPSSISAFYWLGLQNYLVGCLCAVAMFQFGCRGYDGRDEFAGIFSAVCAVGVAFFPTVKDESSGQVPWVHYTFAGLLFVTLACTCLFLFRLTDQEKPTPRKLLRNWIYLISGLVIVASIAAIAVCALILKPVYFPYKFVFETTSLVAFGIAWLVKGEAFLKDLPSETHSHREPERLAKAHIA